MIDALKYTIESLSSYPSEQWNVAVSRFMPPSNRAPKSFWRLQRENAIGLLKRYNVDVAEKCGKVFIGDLMVDGSYIEF